MTKRRIATLVMGTVFIAAIMLGAVRSCRFIDYGVEDPGVAVFSSPNKSKSAYLVCHGALMGRTLTLLVSPSNSENGSLVWIGSVSADDSLIFQSLVWSRDGTLIAARCHVGGYNGKLPQGTWDEGLYTHGYDFSTSNRLSSARDVFDSSQAWIIRHLQIEELLLQRGGGGTAVSEDDLRGKMRKMKWFEWREWRQRLQRAKAKGIQSTDSTRL